MGKAGLQHFFRKRVINVDARQRHFIFAVLFGKIQAVLMLVLPISLVNGNGNIISAFNSRELDAFRKSPLLQSSRGSYTSPALSCDSYPFVDLPPRNDCRSNHSWATSFRMFIANSHPCDRIKKMKL